MGSRFENLSGHERSCILSGQHRTGHCTCRLNNHDVNSNDDTNARASISRIVMLAEALFEVVLPLLKLWLPIFLFLNYTQYGFNLFIKLD